MADGRTHQTVALLVASASTATVPFAFGAGVGPEAAALTVGTYIGVLNTPDIDHHARTVEEKRWYSLPGGWLWGRLYQGFWAALAVWIPHRSPLTHGLLLGTVVRWLYVLAKAAPWLVILWLLGARVGVDALAWLPLLAWVFAGHALQDAGHILMDILWSGGKRR